MVNTRPDQALRRRRLTAATCCLLLILVTMVISLDRRRGPGDSPDRERAEDARVTPGPVEGVLPTAGGVTHGVASPADWDAAVAAARPGDVIRLTRTITEPLIYRGRHDGGPGTGADGTAAAPIVITADPGARIDLGAFETRGYAALNLWYVDHVHAVGLEIRNAQYGIRCLRCRGTAAAPVRIAGNTVSDVGYVGIHVGGDLTDFAASKHVLVEHNVVTRTGRLIARFGEGVYLGHGGDEWEDETSDVTVRSNEISYTTAEGIDIKPGTRNIVVEDNLLHHIAPIDGGSITAHYVNGEANPHPSRLDRVVIRRNRIWNQNLNGAPGASDAAIWVGHGGVEIVDNRVWGFRIHYNTRAVRIQARQSFGPHPIRIENNTFWLERGWVAAGHSGTRAIVAATGNRGVHRGSSEVLVDASDFVGPVPSIGSGGSADAGAGPGSGLVLAASQSVPAPPPPPPQPAPPPTQPAPAPPPAQPAPAPSPTRPPVTVPAAQPAAAPRPAQPAPARPPTRTPATPAPTAAPRSPAPPQPAAPPSTAPARVPRTPARQPNPVRDQPTASPRPVDNPPATPAPRPTGEPVPTPGESEQTPTESSQPGGVTGEELAGTVNALGTTITTYEPGLAPGAPVVAASPPQPEDGQPTMPQVQGLPVQASLPPPHDGAGASVASGPESGPAATVATVAAGAARGPRTLVGSSAVLLLAAAALVMARRAQHLDGELNPPAVS